MKALRNWLAMTLLVPPIVLIAAIRVLLNRPAAGLLVAMSLVSVASAQGDGWAGQPGEYLGHGPDYRTVWDWQPEYRPCPGRYYRDCYGQLFYSPPTNCFTGRVTLQPQRRVYQSFRIGNATYTGWSDAQYGLFRNY